VVDFYCRCIDGVCGFGATVAAGEMAESAD